MNNFKLNKKQQYALALMLSGKNVFLTGEAGTGKSIVIQTLKEITQYRNDIAFVAPTGIAALNLQGQTIHSFFHFRLGLLCEDTLPPVKSSKQYSRLKNVQTIVIDEISMVRPDTFAAIDIRLRQVEQDPVKKQMPFAGKQIIVVGDFFQLPPVALYNY